MLAGFTVLAHPDTVSPIALRIGGDAMDLAVLAAALTPANRNRNTAWIATLAVAGITLLDLATAAGLRRRATKALQTARRTRVTTA